jgi:putative Holliday junction resolvase
VGRLLGIDHGDRRIGLALSDPIPMIASPLKTIIVNNQSEAILTILDIISDKDVSLVIIGLPIGMKGLETAQTKHVLQFIEELRKNNIEVAMQDERLSSISAKRSYQEDGIKLRGKKELIDETAAAIMLQQYIDANYR